MEDGENPHPANFPKQDLDRVPAGTAGTIFIS